MDSGTASLVWSGMPKRRKRSMPDKVGELLSLAEAVRTACVKADRDGYQDAAISGLCGEGAQEAAISAIQMVDIDSIIICREVSKLKIDV